MKNVTQYHIVQESTANSLVTKVNEYIKKGWQPQGGMTIQVIAGNIFCYQPMVR